MPSISNAPKRGDTFYGPTSTIPSSYGGSSLALEGVPGRFIDSISTAPNVRRSGRKVCGILVRNDSGITLVGGLAVAWSAGYRGTRVSGFPVSDGAEVAGIVDPWYGGTGVRDNDLFWIIVKGPCEVHTPYQASGAFNGDAWAEGDVMYVLTGSSVANTIGASNTDNGGRLNNLTTSLACTSNVLTSGAIHLQLQNAVGRCMSACTSHETTGSLYKLVDIDLPCF